MSESTLSLGRDSGHAGRSNTIEELLAYVVAEGYVDTSATPVRACGLAAIADTFAIAVGGLAEDLTQAALDSVSATTGERSGSVWHRPERYTLGDAAFVTGVAAHALDWDDYMHPMHGHCSSVLLPVAWTLAEARGMTGEDLLEAFLVGYQVDYLTGLLFSEAHYARGWHATSTVGTLGAAATAARLLGLDQPRALSAMALAASFAAGLRVNFGTPAKAIHVGAAARNGIQAALLADAGVVASPRWLTGPLGMLEVFGSHTPPSDVDVDGLASLAAAHGITSNWGLVQKPYACCGSCHAALDAVQELVSRSGGIAERIMRVEVHLDSLVPDIMRAPYAADPLSARYCLPWAIAAAAVDGAAGPAQFSEAALRRSDIHAMTERIQIVPDLITSPEDRFAARVVVFCPEGSYEAAVRHAAGHPANPMSSGARMRKQHLALDPVLGTDTATRVVELLTRIDCIEDLRDVSALVRSAFVDRAGGTANKRSI